MKTITIEQGNQVFLKEIKKFKTGKISLDEFSLLSEKIFHKFGKKYPKSDLFQASLAASELKFSIRTKEVFGNVILFLKDIENFLIKYDKKSP